MSISPKCDHLLVQIEFLFNANHFKGSLPNNFQQLLQMQHIQYITFLEALANYKYLSYTNDLYDITVDNVKNLFF